jgi:hypothetical protein
LFVIIIMGYRSLYSNLSVDNLMASFVRTAG